MVPASPSAPLSHLEVLVVDCQATAAAPRGHLLEIGWARVLGTPITHAHASLIALPDGEQIPPAVARITGISEHMMRSAVDGRCAWRELTDQAANLTQQPAPTVIHFARFEQPFLRAAVEPTRRQRRIWPMPRDVRLSLPDAPGIYRMLRTDGSVLYVGKAASLRHRVNSYFQKQNGVPERSLEMLSQARAISFDVSPSPLEATLLEADEIKRHRPPYNVALTIQDRAPWFTSPDLSTRRSEPSPDCPLGPFASAETLDRFAAFARAQRAALTAGSRGPDDGTFTAGYDRLCAAHPELSRVDLSDCAKLLRLGTRLWREGRRDRDVDDDDGNETRRG